MSKAVSEISNPQFSQRALVCRRIQHKTARLSVCPLISDAVPSCQMKRDFSSFKG